MNMKKITALLIVLLVAGGVFFLGFNANKTDLKVSAENSKKTPQQLKLFLQEKLPRASVERVEASQLAGFYQVFIDTNIIYVSEDGRYLLSGALLDISGDEIVNLSVEAMQKEEQRNAPQRRAMLASLDQADMVVYPAESEKYVITVFTDTECGYCRKLHSEVTQLNALGVTVRYLAFPRAGIGSSAFKKLESIWCADDPAAAMNDLKLNGKFTQRSCSSPIVEQLELGRKMNISGTPAILLNDGEIIGGYLPANQLVAHLSDKYNGEKQQ